MLSPDKVKKLEKLAKVLDGGDIALLDEMNALEERLEGLQEQIPDVQKALDRVEALVDGEKGDDGDDYVLTDDDKKEIASLITVPVVEKVIERTEVIKEVPIVTNNVTNEIVKETIEKQVEVAVLDEATVAYLEEEIKRVEEKIPEVVKQRETNFGFVIRDVVAGTGVTIDKSDPNRPVVSATGGTGSSAWGDITGTLSDQSDLATALSDKSDVGHTHENVYEPVRIADQNYVTNDEKYDLHGHNNKSDLDNVSGTNSGDNATNSQYSGLATSKQDTLISGTNIKTINSTSLLGSGDIVISSSSNVDGGGASSVYGGTSAIDGGLSSTTF